MNDNFHPCRNFIKDFLNFIKNMNNCEAIIQLHCMGVNTITIIKQEFWPSSSPDLNPMDFSIWSVLEKACASFHLNVEALKHSLEKEWKKI